MTNLPTIPLRVMRLPTHEGNPIPFAAALDADGKPDIGKTDPRKWALCLQKELCWTCGVKLGAFKAFVVSPLQAIRRISFQPPMHLDCAEWMTATWLGLQEGMWVIWTCKGFRRMTPKGKPLESVLALSAPESVSWWTHGQRASLAQVTAHFDRVLPAECASFKHQHEMDLFERQWRAFVGYVPEAPEETAS